MYIARDDYGLWLFVNKPVKTIFNGDKYFIKRDNIRYSIDSNLFPEVTFENSPQEVEFKLVNEIVGVAESPSKTFPRVNEFETGASYRH